MPSRKQSSFTHRKKVLHVHSGPPHWFQMIWKTEKSFALTFESMFHKLIWVFNYGKLIYNSIYLISSSRKINRQGLAHTLDGTAKCSSEGSSPLCAISNGPTSAQSAKTKHLLTCLTPEVLQVSELFTSGDICKTITDWASLIQKKKINALDMRTFLIQTLGLVMFNL